MSDYKRDYYFSIKLKPAPMPQWPPVVVADMLERIFPSSDV
uniref:Uncharacterized protein n=1 Tax=Bartonella schoenbuchensis (strain DSM 13525 / NCTC 13165 / R1) TaxID=687861 RepID=E6Z0T8_BARSR|nr:hypothetical protein BARSC_170001 [Bartonella schoenbuchensis R1]